TGVARNTTVQATFSRALDASTVSASTFTLKKPDNSTVPATVAYDATSKTATLTPSAQLDPGTIYTAQLTTGIRSSGDLTPLAIPVTWTFTTVNSTLAVTGHAPADGALGVPASVAPTVTFNQPMVASTINSSTFVLSTFGDGSIAATISYDSATDTATLTPNSSLAMGTTYAVHVDGSVQAQAGATLGTAVNWTFTTGGCPCSLFVPTAH